MSSFEKLKTKFNRKPIPNDMTFDEIATIASHYGCIVVSGGKHSKKIVHRESGTVIPIPMHGNTVGEAYIKELKKLFDSLETE